MEIRIPDVNPSNLPCYGLFSMAAGDFLEIYHKEGSLLLIDHIWTNQRTLLDRKK